MPDREFSHPFQPYDIQQQFMEAVFNCIEDGGVGIFESPTGTGKSLSLICSSLSWLREHKRNVFYRDVASIRLDDDEPEWMREHAMKYAIDEIKRTRDEFEARLAAVREREQKIKDRHVAGQPPYKKKKQEHDAIFENQDEDQFMLDEYHSDNGEPENKKGQYSAETVRIMEKMGLLEKSSINHKVDSVEETKVYFTSRTHSQLSQFVGELKRVRLPSALPPNNDKLSSDKQFDVLKHLSLGSRKNLCVNPKVSRLPSQTEVNERCIELQQSKVTADQKCQFLPGKDSEDIVLDFRDHALARIRDIEDLAQLGTKLQVCPYYASRPAIEPAEIVTLPYPLLLQKSARESLGISLKGNVVIIDEAHNIINAVEGIYSSQVSDTQLRRARDGLFVYLHKFRNRLKGSNRSYVTQTVRVIDSLLHFASSVKDKGTLGAHVSPDALLAGKNVDQINIGKLIRYMTDSKLARKVEGYATYTSDKTQGLQSRIGVEEDCKDVPSLTHVQNFLMALLNPSREGRFMWSKSDGTVTIRYLLLDPSEHFREIVEDARAVILAGGTMSPMKDYQQQLFPYLDSITTFSCGHLIPKDNLFVRAISSDQDGCLDFGFKSRTPANAIRLGNSLRQVAEVVSGGMIVFFPSYVYLEAVIQTWKSKLLFQKLQESKSVFYDSRMNSNEDTFRAFSDAVQSSKGALLLSVIGGKLSEGINFSDDLGRCVVVVGLPYPNVDTPEWKAKLQYLDEKAEAKNGTNINSSREHVENVCMRSVNQAIGRAIRHRNDWASILLFDARFSRSHIQAKLPGWIRESSNTTASGSMQDVVDDMRRFFKQKERKT